MRRSDTIQIVFNVDLYIFMGGKPGNRTLWRFEIGLEALTRYDNVTLDYTSLDFKYSLLNGVMVMTSTSQVVANQISTNKLYQLTVQSIIGASSIVDKTLIFNASGYYTIDWPSETSNWTDQPGIYITFGGPGYAVYCQTITSTTSSVCLYTTSNTQGTCATVTMSSTIIRQVSLGATKNLLWSHTNVYLYDSSTNAVIGFSETYQNIANVIPFGDNFYVFDNLNSGTIQMNTYTQVTNNNFNYASATVAMIPEAIVGNDFVSASKGLIGPDLNAQSPIALTLPNSRAFAYSNNYFFVMNSQAQKLFYSQIDVYNLITEKWEDAIMPGFTFSTDSYVRAAVLNNSIFLWLYNSIEIYDLQTGTWDSIATDVLVTGEDSPEVEIPPIILNDTALLRADPEMRFYWFQPRDIWTPIGPAVPLDKEPQVALFQYCLHNDVIYVVKKGSKQPYYSLIYYYDISVGEWNSFSLRVAVDNVTVVMATVNNFIAFFGDQLLQSYHIPTGTWSLTALPQTIVFSTVLQTDRNMAMLAGGTLNGDPTDIVYLLTDDGIEPTIPPSTPNAKNDPATSTPANGSSGLTSGELAAAIVVPVGIAVIAGVLLAVLLMRRQKKRKGTVSTIGLEAKYGEWYTPFSDITFGQQLGQGASGQVFSGTWKSTKVALKVSATQANQTVINELQLMITLRPHPNVVQLLGFSVHPETHNVILIIEFCNQGSLDSTLHDKNKEVSMEQKMSWLVGIAKGLSHLHSNNIIHRDVAARNVLLHQNEAKITDFGMSRLIDDQKQHGTTKSELGPIRWMAPESIRAKQYSAKSDVWSFGILMYEVISRQEPHSSADPIEIGRLIRDQGLTPSVPSSCPTELSTLMKECWHMNADQRPNIDDVVNQLENSSFV